MAKVFVPNTASVSEKSPQDLTFGQNWFASVLGQRQHLPRNTRIATNGGQKDTDDKERMPGALVGAR